MNTTAEKIARFRTLQRKGDPLLMPNAWDARSAATLAELGFAALGTSSEAIALSLGREDYQITREESLAAAREVIEAAPALPVSADLESGFGQTVEEVVETIRQAGEIGLAGCSIEDAWDGTELYPFAESVARLASAIVANRALEAPMVLTARVEHHLQPDPHDLIDTITRLRAYTQAGADVLFAPGLPNLEAVREVAAALSAPLSVIGPMAGGTLTIRALKDAGVGRISTATSLYRVGAEGLKSAAEEICAEGTFRYTNNH